MKKQYTFIIALTMFASLFAGQTMAATVSNFDSDLDGWTVLGCTVQWQASGGNPGGSVIAIELDKAWSQLIAPSQYHGSWSSTGVLLVDVVFKGPLPTRLPLAFAVSNGQTAYEYVFSTTPSQYWTTYSVAMNDVSWKLARYSDWYNWTPPSGNDTLANVLKSVTDFRIRADFSNYTDARDVAWLDNVNAPTASIPIIPSDPPADPMATPIPPTLWLLGFGLLGLWGVRRKTCVD